MSGSEKRNDAGIKSRVERWSVLLSLLAGAVMVVLLAWMAVEDNSEVTRQRAETGYRRLTDYSCIEIEDENTPIGVKKEYRFTLDSGLSEDTHLAFYTVHQYVEVWLDGESIYSIIPSDMGRLTKTVGSNWVMIPLYREDAGKEIRVMITPVYENFRDREVEFLMGSELAIYRNRLIRDLPQLILGIMAIFVGMIFVCVAGYNIYKKHRGKSIAALGFFSMMMGIWRLTDTRFTPFIMPDRPVLLFYISVGMLMLGMVPLIKWAEEYFTGKSRFLLNGYCIATSLLCLIQLALQLLGLRDIRSTLYVTHIEIGVGGLLLFGCGIYEKLKKPKKSRIFMGNGLVYLCVAGVVADMAAYYIKGNSSGLLFSLMAFLLYIVFMGIATLYQYSEQEMQLAATERQLAEKDRLLAEQERKLTDRRIAAMMSQIRTHFIFNVLTTISGYCKIDPKKADDALIHFSRYLRKNIRIIEEEGLVDFSVELEQLEDYIALEQMRFTDMITFKKDIETSSFQIPPLTIQPLVENAIKHGLVEHDKTGTILLTTRRTTQGIEITVEDDGVGFVPEECEKEESVGIRNVRYRLQTMVDGELRIESSPGKGTKVTVFIPDQK